MRRSVRIYFPRNFEGVKDLDFIIFAGSIMNMFTPTQQHWMQDAVAEGTGGLNSRSLLSGIYYPEWAVSATQKAFPNDVDALTSMGSTIFRSGKDLQIILEEGPEVPQVMSMFKDKNIWWNLNDYSCGRLIPREGATVVSWIKGPFADLATVKPGCTPHLMFWTYGKGITWTSHDRLVNWWQDPLANPYGLDMIMNMILFSEGRDLPEDIDIVHEIRSKIVEYNTRQLLVLATIEFGERFGANMDPVLVELGVVGETRDNADDHYLSQDYLLAREGYLGAIKEMEDLNVAAMDRKDRAMVWVYLVQWFVVSGTSMATGFVVWTLMVRRRLYRQVQVTRFSGGD
jgi:hypothetical protein